MRTTRPSLKILIVEDQFLIARQVEMILASAGHAVIGIASTMREACQLAVSEEPDLALVDLSLADGVTGPEIGRFIKEECGAEVVFTTANFRRLPNDLCGAIGVVEKPFTKGDLLAAMAYIATRIVDGLIPETTPPCIRLPARPMSI